MVSCLEFLPPGPTRVHTFSFGGTLWEWVLDTEGLETDGEGDLFPTTSGSSDFRVGIRIVVSAAPNGGKVVTPPGTPEPRIVRGMVALDPLLVTPEPTVRGRAAPDTAMSLF